MGRQLTFGALEGINSSDLDGRTALGDEVFLLYRVGGWVGGWVGGLAYVLFGIGVWVLGGVGWVGWVGGVNGPSSFD